MLSIVMTVTTAFVGRMTDEYLSSWTNKKRRDFFYPKLFDDIDFVSFLKKRE